MEQKQPFDTEEAQRIRDEYLAPAYLALERLAESQPAQGQYLTFSKNHVRQAFTELGFGMALAKGLDPMATKVLSEEERLAARREMVNETEAVMCPFVNKVDHDQLRCGKMPCVQTHGTPNVNS